MITIPAVHEALHQRGMGNAEHRERLLTDFQRLFARADTLRIVICCGGLLTSCCQQEVLRLLPPMKLDRQSDPDGEFAKSLQEGYRQSCAEDVKADNGKLIVIIIVRD